MNQKKKILYLVTQSEMGGAQRYIFNLATTLSSEFEIIVGAGGKGELLQKLEKENIKTINLEFTRSINNPFRWAIELFKLFKIIKKEKPNIIHLNSSKMGVLGAVAAKLAGVKKVIYTVHGFAFNEPMPTIMKKFYIWAEKFSSFSKDILICVSDFDKNEGLKYKIAPAKKLTTIHNGIDGNLIFFKKEEAKRLLGLKVTYNIGTLANFYPTKDLLTLIEAAAITIKKFPSVNFVIIGEGQERKLLEQKIKKLNLEKNVILVGQKKDAFRYLSAFDIYVCSSTKEGFPLSILEAMLAGLPIISTNVGGIPEMIRSGYNGLLVEPRNPEGLAEKIIGLLVDQEGAKRLAKAAKQTVLNAFNLEKMVAQTKEIYLK